MYNEGVEKEITKGGATIIAGVEVMPYTRLKEVLTEQGRKQNWLCKQTGIDPTWMTKLANGTSLPNVHHAQKIAKVLGVTVEELWPLEGDKDRVE